MEWDVMDHGTAGRGHPWTHPAAVLSGGGVDRRAGLAQRDSGVTAAAGRGVAEGREPGRAQGVLLAVRGDDEELAAAEAVCRGGGDGDHPPPRRLLGAQRARRPDLADLALTDLTDLAHLAVTREECGGASPLRGAGVRHGAGPLNSSLRRVDEINRKDRTSTTSNVL